MIKCLIETSYFLTTNCIIIIIEVSLNETQLLTMLVHVMFCNVTTYCTNCPDTISCTILNRANPM